MTEAYDQLIDHLRITQTVTVVTSHPDGSPVAAPIWAVVVDGVPYVRAAFGEGSSWFVRAVSGRPMWMSLADGSIAENDRTAALAGPLVPVTPDRLDVDDPREAEVSAAYEAKYGPTSPAYVPSVTDEKARSRTLALLPA